MFAFRLAGIKLLSLVALTLVFVATSASAVFANLEPRNNLPTTSKQHLSLQRRSAILNNNPRRMGRRSKRHCKAKSRDDATTSKGAKQHSGSPSQVSSQNKSGTSSNSGFESDSESKTSSSVSGGLFGFTSKNCGSSGANDDQPNGSQDFLNCGLTSGGWKPPQLSLSQLRIMPASQASTAPVFAPCKEVLWAFEAAEKAHGVPATVLMSFAMQESTCNPNVTGGNGEQGLMQITRDKCRGAPNGNCKDPWFNVDTGARYFKTTLDQCGGNVLQAIGQYNGWQLGLTVKKATAAKAQGNCHAQNNLDYLYQMLNGWFLGKANTYDIGSYKNLAAC
ncbi:hypothetical protein NDA11_005822 [Ustilago hordei]|nr:hypothetical protein NDA11_005822 [Ustilago hordei]KAJ1603650.1 hypothetical protein NDA14_002427 [Ustilago hordei]KAJ1603856.1 hypothetical protein NDA14_004102 [Ustilago hordei]UTT88303.1 hypothetical protein NDA17_006098 [Ustilago hordei]